MIMLVVGNCDNVISNKPWGSNTGWWSNHPSEKNMHVNQPTIWKAGRKTTTNQPSSTIMGSRSSLLINYMMRCWVHYQSGLTTINPTCHHVENGYVPYKPLLNSHINGWAGFIINHEISTNHDLNEPSHPRAMRFVSHVCSMYEANSEAIGTSSCCHADLDPTT